MMEDSLHVFSQEAEDLLIVAEQALLVLDKLEELDDIDDTVNDIFRTFHTIKGAAGLFGLDAIVDFTHVVESVLGKVRENSIAVDQDMVSLFLLSRDHLEKLVASALEGERLLSDGFQNANDDLVAKLTVYLCNPEMDTQSVEGYVVPKDDPKQEGSVANKNWHISLRFSCNAMRNGMDPASFIGYLHKLGEPKSVILVDDGIPAWESFDPESCYLGFEIELLAPKTMTKDSIEDVFEFVQDDCTIHILPPHSHIDAYIEMIEELPEEELRIGEILFACGALTQRERDDVLNVQDRIADEVTASGVDSEVPQLGKVAVGQKVVQQAVVDAAVKKQNELKIRQANAQRTIRVNALKLESLVNLVGELVIGSANADLNAKRLSDGDLSEAMENLLRLVEEVRDTTLSLRMVQIGETFNRYKRVVREVSRDLGKEIDLKISGAETELDKTLTDKIGDPLMHLVRNAIDHGIESPEKRIAIGKPARGTVTLDAYHDSGSIVIQICDDGAGLSKEKILNKALENGLIQDGQQLSDQEIYRLVFAAGFSTADTLSNLSGRGVGMDVVRKNVEELRGQVDIRNNEGEGSTVSIRLPLTMAIIDGFQVRVGEAYYIVPLDMVEECIELDESLTGCDESNNYINLRGEILPFMRLGEVFGLKDDSVKKYRDNIVVVEAAGKKVGFVVDELLGEHQTVIKPLGRVFQNLRGISGATILGSGEVAMIVDVAEMISRVEIASEQRIDGAHALH